MVDYSFTQITAFTRGREMLQQNAIGALRHVIVNWHTENYTNRARIENWKASAQQGGGTFSNFVSHSLHYLEWFMGPIVCHSSSSVSSRQYQIAGTLVAVYAQNRLDRAGYCRSGGVVRRWSARQNAAQRDDLCDFLHKPCWSLFLLRLTRILMCF